MKKGLVRTLALVLVSAIVISLAGCGGAPAKDKPSAGGSAGENKKVTIRVATHWGQDYSVEELMPYIAEYQKLNPNVEIKYEAVPFGEYFKKVQVSHLSGDAPDIYHVYSLWGVQLSRSGVIAEAPQDVVDFTKKEYAPAALAGANFDGKIWGIPTEIDDYQLYYNKKLLADAGYKEPPKTLEELYTMAKKITKLKPDGTIDVAGISFMKGWESAYVHPFMSLVLSNGGRFLTDDGKKAAFNSPEGVEALEFEGKLFKEKITDPSLDYEKLFPVDKAAFVIMAPYWKNGLKKTMGEKFSNVGIAPIPVGKSGKPNTTGYTWFFAVDKNSKVKEEAWKFLLWLNGAKSASDKTSRIGTYLTTLGVIPGRLGDQEAQPGLQDGFSKPFVEALKYTTVEPNLPMGQEIKTELARQIEEVWYGRKTAKAALDDAAAKVNEILAQK
ncbi:MAG: sugar ABC transporter substrate-binding protein [Firmicutes bacterium]|nr:sugar ABC transporter substrate-binding protein [Bacillota bacterium]